MTGRRSRSYGVARSWICTLLARYQAEGEAAFEPRSRRPQTSPRAIGPEMAGLIVRLRKELTGQGLDAGPVTIAWHLEHHYQALVSPAAISRHLARRGLITPQPRQRPRSSCIRFQAEQPSQCRQADFTRYPLPHGTGTEILTWLDDHCRYALPVTACHRVTGPVVLTAFQAAVAAHGAPASTVTGNGMVVTTRLSGGRGGRNGLEHELRRPGIRQKNGKPDHPQTQGKAERFQQTMKNGSPPSPASPPSIAGLQQLPDQFTATCHHHRPHRSPPRRQTPAAAGAARPQATPGNRDTDTHDRVRTDKIRAVGTVTPPPRRQAPPHRRRTRSCQDRSPHPHPGPAHPHHQQGNRRAPPRAHPRPRPRLPAHRQAIQPEKASTLSPARVQGVPRHFR